MTSENTIAKFLRLKNGDDVISEVVEIQEDDEHFYMLINPLKAVYMPSATGYLSIAFMPWVFPRICDRQEFTIHYDDILLISDVGEKMNEYYWDSVDTYINENKEEMINKKTEDEPNYEEEIASIMETIKDKRTMH